MATPLTLGIPSWVGVSLVLSIFGLLLAVLVIVRRKWNVHPEVPRKCAHVVMGLLLLALPWLFDSILPATVLAILSIALFANLLIACVFYYILKVEIHIYSLAGITVSFGIIIDNSILMVTHLQKHKGLRVFISILAATLTTLGALSVVFFLKENQKICKVTVDPVVKMNQQNHLQNQQ